MIGTLKSVLLIGKIRSKYFIPSSSVSNLVIHFMKGFIGVPFTIHNDSNRDKIIQIRFFYVNYFCYLKPM